MKGQWNILVHNTVNEDNAKTCANDLIIQESNSKRSGSASRTKWLGILNQTHIFQFQLEKNDSKMLGTHCKVLQIFRKWLKSFQVYDPKKKNWIDVQSILERIFYFLKPSYCFVNLFKIIIFIYTFFNNYVEQYSKQISTLQITENM